MVKLIFATSLVLIQLALMLQTSVGLPIDPPVRALGDGILLSTLGSCICMGCEPIVEGHIKDFSRQVRGRGAQRSQNGDYELIQTMEPHSHTGPRPSSEAESDHGHAEPHSPGHPVNATRLAKRKPLLGSPAAGQTRA
ncbi:hypothetical protein F5887DRAFT_969640 [Amanita rubescens]|nr:hypothetical protein F5887DRAFT_969640 [Amanita rubescens]